jgi:Domain of unknown function (DUF4440)
MQCRAIMKDCSENQEGPSVTIRIASASDALALARLRYALRSSLDRVHENEESFVERCRLWMEERLQDHSLWKCWIAERDQMAVGNLWAQLIDLRAIAPRDSYITDERVWERLWQAWRGSEPLPKVNLNSELIVFCTTISPNSCGIKLSLDEQGDLKITSVSTLIASKAKTINYQIGLIDRAGIKSIERRPITSGNAARTDGTNDEIVERLKRMTQELLEAIAPGDKAVWQRYLAEGSIYADEEGRVLTKDQLIKELNPLPAGYVGSIKIGDTKILVQDNVVVLSHRDREELELYGQKIITYFHMTNTWARQSDGQWQLVSTHVMAIPNERKPAPIDLKSLDSYVGYYELAPQVFYTITREGDKVFGQRTGRAKEELLPLCVDTFYRKGVWRGEKVFVRDAGGRVTAMHDRRENNDLIWKKVK